MIKWTKVGNYEIKKWTEHVNLLAQKVRILTIIRFQSSRLH